jgi:hypothetical protein
MILGVQNATNGTYGATRFASSSTNITQLTSSSMAITAVNNAPYSGGYTNTEAGIRNCDAVLGSLGNRVLVILTDGNPTACTQGPSGNDCGNGDPDNSAVAAASLSAQTARAKNITIISVGVGSETAISNQNLLNWAEGNANNVLRATNFTALDELISHLVGAITCV